ncbi:protein-L-isoaspartate O-methyltransferase [mine drainage metagenome]|uniref:protein-L-isoaspartate(D-aspartate) O-methyltransferase n=1 Tax=mine drainage metagenome TaxID=410659 RepID=A0A1J5QX85_9ZZZZ
MDKHDFMRRREWMVRHQIAGRGVHSSLVLDAMRAVPREIFLPENLWEFAYEDAPLPIAEGRTISQPYIVALMIAALDLNGGEKVLEIGTGSGYAAAVLSRIARNVYTVERIGQLAEKAAATLSDHGFENVHVLHADGMRGWQDHAPYDAIVVAAGNAEIPESLKTQLKIGGRLVIPVGIDRRVQELVRVIRVSEHQYKREDMADIRFVISGDKEEWGPDEVRTAAPKPRLTSSSEEAGLSNAIAAHAEQFDEIDSADLKPLLQRIGDARIVLLGEATHGTSEFYRMRERISRALIASKGFTFIAIEGDWPDAARVDHYVRHAEFAPSEWTAFARFPTWMWRNREVSNFIEWLRGHNASMEPVRRVAFHGLDLYSLYNSIQSVLSYLDRVDPQTAQVARERYGCLTPWQTDPTTYGHAVLTQRYQTCEHEVVSMLKDLLQKNWAYAEHDGERFLDAIQNARLVANAERYYRTMYYGSRTSWNLRDGHMFETLQTLLAFYGPQSKAIIWAHNSHVGDSAATEMSLRGEFNIGNLIRKKFGRSAYAVGFGTNRGTVAAASDWDGPLEIKKIRSALPKSYERLFHEAGISQFFLPLRGTGAKGPMEGLEIPRLERAIGVIYRPETELQSHYFEAVLPQQFDEYVWFDQTTAISPLKTEMLEGQPDTYPFGV